MWRPGTSLLVAPNLHRRHRTWIDSFLLQVRRYFTSLRPRSLQSEQLQRYNSNVCPVEVFWEDSPREDGLALHRGRFSSCLTDSIPAWHLMLRCDLLNSGGPAQVRKGRQQPLCASTSFKRHLIISNMPLLSHLFELGINGKCWRLIKSWYTNPTSVVKHNGELPQGFCVCRGVRQGSVLSPILFLEVMDVLLKQLEQSGLGLTISGLNAGCAAHADDIRASQ